MNTKERNPFSTLILLLFFIFFCGQANAYNRSYCDSIVKKGIDDMLGKDYAKALDLLMEGQNISKENHWNDLQFKATNNIGATYYYLLDYGEALHYYLDAYNIALQLTDATKEMTVLNNIAILYSKEKKYEQANEYFTRAYEIAKTHKLFEKLGIYALNLGINSNATDHLQEAKDYLNEALLYLKVNTQMNVDARIGLLQNQFKEGKINETTIAAVALLDTAKAGAYYDETMEILIFLIKANLKENRPDKALSYCNEALTLNKDLETRLEIFNQLSEIYLKNKSTDLAFAAKDSVIKLQDSINTVKNGRLYENSKLKFELQNSKQSLALNEARLSNQSKILYATLIFIAILIVFAIWLFRMTSIKNKQKIIIAERSNRIALLEIEKERQENLLLEKQLKEKETFSLLEQERLKNEIELRNRKLSAKALYLSGRDELIEEIINALAKIPDLSKDENLVKHIFNLKSHLKSGSEWDDFSSHFEEVNQGFLTKLKTRHPGLTANDIRFISYIYMNLSTKEIASALNITAEGCRKRKERLSVKMELPEGVSLYDYLSIL